MKLKFIANACNVIEHEGVKLLTDPWLIDGAFYGAWYHYPPLKSKPEDFKDVDGIYISHLHPDHYQPESLKRIGIDKPILILKRDKNFLKNVLIRDGFTNIVEFENGVTTTWKSMDLTFFDAFTGNPFAENEFGNPLDTALVIRCGGQTVFNANDNTPDIAACRMLRERFGKFTVAQLNYNAAGPYPACFTNLSDIQKVSEHKRILNRNLKHMVECARILEPEYVQPFAGAYVLGGRNVDYNLYLGTVPAHEAARHLHAAGIKTFSLLEGQEFEKFYSPTIMIQEYNQDYMMDYLERLRDKPYDYEDDPYPDMLQLSKDVDLVATKLGLEESIHEPKNMVGDIIMSFKQPEGYIACSMDARLLRRILDRKAHWNNAEIGCHIQFHRDLNIYNYDFHMKMSYFHL